MGCLASDFLMYIHRVQKNKMQEMKNFNQKFAVDTKQFEMEILFQNFCIPFSS